MMTIAFAGTHCTGKTVLVEALHEALGIQKITNTVRNNLPREMHGTKYGQDHIVNIYMHLLEGLEGKEYISDRTIYDIVGYSRTYGVWDDERCQEAIADYIASPAYPTYLFYLPIEFGYIEEKDRGIIDTRESVDQYIYQYLSKYADYYTITGTVEERVAKILKIIGK